MITLVGKRKRFLNTTQLILTTVVLSEHDLFSFSQHFEIKCDTAHKFMSQPH